MRLASLALLLPLLAATPAMAELRIQGEARMGLVRDTGSGTGSETGPDTGRRDQVLTGTRIEFELSRETQGGLRLGVMFGLSDGRLPARGPRD